MTALVDRRLEFEGVDSVRASFPNPIEWGESLTFESDALRMSPPLLKAELVITDGNGRRHAAMPVDFDRRATNGVETSLLGQGAGGSMQVELRAAVPTVGVKLRFRFVPQPASTPTDLREAVDWFDALGPSRRLGLWMSAGGRWAIEPGPIPADHPHVPDDYARAVRVLARIEQRTGAKLVMPAEITDADAQAVGAADALVKGRTVVGHWSEATINEDQQLLDFFAGAEHGAMLEFSTDYSLVVGNQSIDIGTVEYRFLQVASAEHVPGDRVTHLRPGSDDRFEVRLLTVADLPRDDGATSWLPGPALEPYAGRWIAQSGTRVVATSETFHELAEKVRASGHLATIWRVPESADDSELLPVVEH